MVLAAQTVDRTLSLVERLLDRGYVDATRQVVTAISRNGSTGVMAARLAELDAEAGRLAAAGAKLRPDNAVFRALTADFETALRRDAALIDGAAPQVQAAGTDAAGTLARQLALPGFGEGSAGIAWNVPDPEAVAALIDFVNKPEWAAALEKYQQGVAGVVNNIAIRGITAGWGPLRAAREIRRVVTTLPAAQANTLMRTLQLSSYRRGTAVHQLANADILEYQIRIASLDDRACLACVALHGTRLPVGEVIADHHNGRCTSIASVRGSPRVVETGEAWLTGLPEARQRAIMGETAFDAWKAGRVRLADFVERTTDPVFGEMVREASLASLGIGRVGRTAAAATSAPVTTGPARTVVSESLELHVTDRARRAAIEEALDAIDRVHGDGPLPTIPVRGTGRVGAQGYYQLSSPTAEQHIAITRRATSPALTMLHETGHFIDHEGQLQTVAPFASLAAARGGQGPLVQWWQAATSTGEYQALESMVRNPQSYAIRMDGGSTWVPDRRLVYYLLEPEEVWARSYTQYIALHNRDANPGLMAQLVAERAERNPYAPYMQWDESNFEPVERAITEAFRQVGWMR